VISIFPPEADGRYANPLRRNIPLGRPAGPPLVCGEGDDIVAVQRNKQIYHMTRKTGVFVVTHGSKLKAANWFMFPLVRELRRRFHNDCILPCFMELGQPDIPTVIRRLVRRGCNHIFGYGLFLVPGKHWQRDVPRIVRETLKEFPGVTFALSEPMMEHDGLADVVERRLARELRQE
jgi:cobalamin biosynthesis Co2+ chelatase CbiK